MILRARIRSWWWRFKRWFRPHATWTGEARNGRPDDPRNWQRGRLPHERGVVTFPSNANYDPPVQTCDGQVMSVHTMTCPRRGVKIGMLQPTTVTRYAQGPREAPQGDAREERDR